MSHAPTGFAWSGQSSQTVAEQFLESLQERVYESIGLSAEDCQQRERLGQQLVLPARLQQKALELSPGEFDAYRDALLDGLRRDEQARRPTRYERPVQYSILRELKISIEHAVDRLGFSLPVQPVIGTLPTRRLEPSMFRVPKTPDPVLVVDGNLLTYVNLLTKAIAQALPLEPTDDGDMALASSLDWRRDLDPRRESAARFVELMLAALDGNPSSAAPYLPEPGYEQAALDLCDGMELFIVGREYARIVEGDYLRARAVPGVAHGETFETLTWTVEQEMKADCLGLAFMLAAAAERGASLSWAFWSADALVASFAILERAAWLLGNPSSAALIGAPPTAHEDRRLLLREMVRQWKGGAEAVVFADALEPVLDYLENELQMHLVDVKFGSPLVH